MVSLVCTVAVHVRVRSSFAYAHVLCVCHAQNAGRLEADALALLVPAHSLDSPTIAICAHPSAVLPTGPYMTYYFDKVGQSVQVSPGISG